MSQSKELQSESKDSQKIHPHPIIPPVEYPKDNILPENLPHQKYKLGDWVYWHQVKNPDFGRITGVIYTTQSNCKITGLHYLISLDKDSPSRSIVHYDFAFEQDIAPLNETQKHQLKGTK